MGKIEFGIPCKVEIKSECNFETALDKLFIISKSAKYSSRVRDKSCYLYKHLVRGYYNKNLYQSLIWLQTLNFLEKRNR